jgi:hypothetical protein
VQFVVKAEFSANVKSSNPGTSASVGGSPAAGFLPLQGENVADNKTCETVLLVLPFFFFLLLYSYLILLPPHQLQ